MDNFFCVIDLGKCFDSVGKLKPIAQNVFDGFRDCYIEHSQSGKGLHIFFKASDFVYERFKASW